MPDFSNPSTQFDTQSIADFSETAYLNYAMYVITDRALPHIGDGLKPVQRRIVYAMSELGLKNTAKPKKSARTVGDVLGKYHPHGDTACYDAMVLMAQPFSYRYPLIDGQGNFGSSDDPKSFAAMRYTESKLSAYAQLLLNELADGATDWQDNFDGSLQEPSVLPARLPNILLNGTQGIAVGMATDIPPHNLGEIVHATTALINNPNLQTADLMAHIIAPDLPTTAHIITPKADLFALYDTGKGSFKMQARTHFDDKNTLVIDALPYQVSGNKVIEQLAKLMTDKKLPFVADIVDEGGFDTPCRIVLTLKRPKGLSDDGILAHLFRVCDLETSYRVNLNMIGLDGKPAIKNLKTILSEWIDYRRTTITRRLIHRLTIIDARLHILAGLLIAYLNLDDVITIIREFDDAKSELMRRFVLSKEQSEAILEIKLRQLAKLKQLEIEQEQVALLTEKADLEEKLANPKILDKLMISELTADAKKFGDKRQSAWQPQTQTDHAPDLSVFAPKEAITVILSRAGWIRTAKGHEVSPDNLSYRTGDDYFAHAKGQSNDLLILLDDTGRSYQLTPNNLPSARGQGEPITGTLKLAGAPTHLFLNAPNATITFVSQAGYGFVTDLSNLATSQKAGKAVVNFAGGLLATDQDGDHLALITDSGRLLVLPIDELPALKKGKGNKLMTLKEEEIAFIARLFANNNQVDSLILTAGKRTLTLKPSDLINYIGKRGARGTLLPKGFSKVASIEVSRQAD